MSICSFRKVHEKYYFSFFCIEGLYKSLLPSVILSKHDSYELSTITNSKRIYEYLYSRMTLQRLLTSLKIPYHGLEKTNSNKPYLRNNVNKGISISHSYPFVSAMFHNSDSVGIDIQIIDSKIEKIKYKFIKNVLPPNDIVELTIHWCAKEAIYKMIGNKSLSLSSIEIDHVMPYNNHCGKCVGRIGDSLYYPYYIIEGNVILALVGFNMPNK